MINHHFLRTGMSGAGAEDKDSALKGEVARALQAWFLGSSPSLLTRGEASPELGLRPAGLLPLAPALGGLGGGTRPPWVKVHRPLGKARQ